MKISGAAITPPHAESSTAPHEEAREAPPEPQIVSTAVNATQGAFTFTDSGGREFNFAVIPKGGMVIYAVKRSGLPSEEEINNALSRSRFARPLASIQASGLPRVFTVEVLPFDRVIEKANELGSPDTDWSIVSAVVLDQTNGWFLAPDLLWRDGRVGCNIQPVLIAGSLQQLALIAVSIGHRSRKADTPSATKGNKPWWKF